MPDTVASPSALSTIYYYLPRMMFLQSHYAAQTHWGDVAQVLRDFPVGLDDVRSAEFCDDWRDRWISQGDQYRRLSGESSTPAGRTRALRSAAARPHGPALPGGARHGRARVVR